MWRGWQSLQLMVAGARAASRPKAAGPAVGPVGRVGVGRGGEELWVEGGSGGQDAGMNGIGLIELDRASTGISDDPARLLH